jgi:hypothetical protein
MLRELGLSGRITWKLMRQFVSAVAVPTLLFYFGLLQGSLAAAVGAAGGWAAVLQVHALIRYRVVDPVILYGLVFTAGQTAVALAAQSPAVFAGSGIAENLLDGLGLLGSFAVHRPLLPSVIDRIIRQHAQAVLTLPVRAALGRLTLVWAVGLLARALGLYVALMHLPLGTFLLVNTLVGWPVTGVGVLASVAYVGAQTRRAARARPERRSLRTCLARLAA